MRVIGIQADITWEDPPRNRIHYGDRIADAARAGAELVALPEMFNTGFTMDPGRLAEPEDGVTEDFLQTMARRNNLAVATSIARKHPGWERPRNVFVLATSNGTLHRYAKMQTFTYGGEAEHYDAGDEVITVDVSGVRVTPLVCYDLRFPEIFAPVAERTDLFVVVANWPRERAAHWSALLVARAIETQAFVLGVNRIGEGGGLEYDGDSVLISPMGEVRANSPSGRPTLVCGEVTAEEVAEVRERFPFLRDRRPDVYRRLS